MNIFEENENLLDRLEVAEDQLESIRIEGTDSVDEKSKKELALEIKTCVSTLVGQCHTEAVRMQKRLVEPSY